MSYITKAKRFWLPSLALMLSQTPLVQAVENDREFVLEPYEVAERMAQHKRQFELNQELRTPLLVTSLDDGIEVTSFENYDEFIITVANQSGFKKQYTNSTGYIDVYNLGLPVDGDYHYEVLAVKHTNEVIYDVMNNGRGVDASTTMTVTEKVNGHFNVVNGHMKIFEAIDEPKSGALPGKVKPQPIKHTLLGGEK